MGTKKIDIIEPVQPFRVHRQSKKKAEKLKEVRENKLELICGKHKLEASQNVLDIGCGWGGFTSDI